MGSFKALIRNFLLNSSGNIIGQFIGFMCIAYLARVLGPSSYGIFSFTQSYYAYFLLLTDLGLSLYIIRASNQRNSTEEVFREIFSLKLTLSFFALIIFYSSIFLFNFSLLEQMSLLLMGSSLLVSGIYIESFFISKNETKYLGISQLLKNLLFYLSCLIFVKESLDVAVVSICFGLGNAVASFYLIIKFKKKYPLKLIGRLKVSYFKTIKLAVPLGISMFMSQISNNFSMLFISFSIGNTEVGYFSAAYKIINFLISILIIYFNTSYSMIAKLLSQNMSALDAFISKFYKLGISVVIPIAAGGILLAREIMITLYGKDFGQAGFLFALFIPIIIVRMVGSTFGAILLMGNGGKHYTVGVTIGAILNVLLSIILIPLFEAKGAVVATVVAEMLQSVYMYCFFKKLCKAKLLIGVYKPALSSLIMILFLITFDANILMKIILGIGVYSLCFAFLNYKSVLALMKQKINKG